MQYEYMLINYVLYHICYCDYIIFILFAKGN